jgi:hypothetical protein
MTQVEQFVPTSYAAKPDVDFPLIVVTSDPEYRNALRLGMQREGHTLALPESLYEAESLFVRDAPPVVVLDSALPEESWQRLMFDIERSGRAPKIVTVRARRNKDRSMKLIGEGEFGIFDEASEVEEIHAVAEEAYQAWLSNANRIPTKTPILSAPVKSALSETRPEYSQKRGEDIVHNFKMMSIAWFITFIVVISGLIAFWTITGVTW